MELKKFFDNFELLADAPNGVQKLRELILQLAVQGKLVPQNPDDEPASVLLEKIKQEKERLIKEGKIKKSKSLPPVDLGEMAFEVPKYWQWERLGNLARFIDYRGKTPPKTSSGIKLITAKNVRMGFIKDEPKEYISEKTYQEWMTRGFPNYGDLLFTTEAPLGNVALLLTQEKIALAQRIINLQFLAGLHSAYLKFALMSSLMQDAILEKATGMTAKGIKSSKLQLILIPLPPLVEQHRIVTKVDALMKLCDELETRQQKKCDRIFKLGQVATTKLITPSTPESFNQHWKTISDNFDLLYSTPENVKQLRQAILQLAVMGKLVPQNPDDEPASVLLEKIKQEKERLIKEGKIKKSKSLPPVDVGEMAFDLPKGWEWVKIGKIVQSLRYGTSKKCSYESDGIPVLRIPNLVNGVINADDLKFTILNKSEFQELRILKNDLLMIRSNGSKSLVGRTAVVDSSIENYAYAGYLVRIRTFADYINSQYLHLALETSFVRNQIEVPIRTTTGVKNINSTEIANLIISLPPFAEQHRIVTKVEAMMKLCDELEGKLTQSISHREKLMSAAVRQVLAV